MSNNITVVAAVMAAAGPSALVPRNAMPMQTLGRTGLIVSRLSFGSWVTFANQVGDRDAYELMKLSYEYGVNLFDNAEAYAKVSKCPFFWHSTPA